MICEAAVGNDCWPNNCLYDAHEIHVLQ